MNWDSLFAARTQQMKRSTVREILKLTARPEVISFAGGLPAPELFPVERIRAATDIVLAERGREVLQYSTSEGMPELRELIAKRLSSGKFQINPENILITSGSQQAIDMIARILLNEGDRVLVENPTYVGMMSTWKAFSPNFAAVPTDDEGMCVDELESMLTEPAKVMYSIPTFQNPQGTTLSRERRGKLVEILVKHNLPFVEDDPYGELRYSGEKVPTMLQMEAELSRLGHAGRLRDVLWHILENSDSRPADRLGGGGFPGDRQAGAGQTGNRFAHQHPQPVHHLRNGAGRGISG